MFSSLLLYLAGVLFLSERGPGAHYRPGRGFEVRKVIDQDLLIDELGQLRVKDVCRVRGRLIGGGSGRSGASTSSEWKSRCAKLTGNWAIDCESLVSNPIV